jgi:hypothetical protein
LEIEAALGLAPSPQRIPENAQILSFRILSFPVEPSQDNSDLLVEGGIGIDKGYLRASLSQESRNWPQRARAEDQNEAN